MSTKKIKSLLAALMTVGVVGAAAPAYAGPFVLDLTVLPTATDAFTGDGKTQAIDELQFFVTNNTVNLTFNGGVPFTVGSTFTFTDTGTILGTQMLPPLPGSDYEGFNPVTLGWTLNGSFSLTGSGSVIGISAGGAPVLSFTFDAGGDVSLSYVDADETILVLSAESVGGTGNVEANPNAPGAVAQTGSGFQFSAQATDLFDGFWLQPDGTSLFLDQLTLVLADGNINSTTTTGAGNNFTIRANSDGSSSLEVLNVPEPGSLALASLALLVAGGLTGRRRRHTA